MRAAIRRHRISQGFSHRIGWATCLALAACSQPAETGAAVSRAISPSSTLESVAPIMRERAVFAAG